MIAKFFRKRRKSFRALSRKEPVSADCQVDFDTPSCSDDISSACSDATLCPSLNVPERDVQHWLKRSCPGPGPSRQPLGELPNPPPSPELDHVFLKPFLPPPLNSQPQPILVSSSDENHSKKAQSMRLPKKVWFSDDMSISSSSYCSTGYGWPTPRDQENYDPFGSVRGRRLPRTNPYFTLPRRFQGVSPGQGGHYLGHQILEDSSSATDSSSSRDIVPGDNRPASQESNGNTMSFTKALAGLKALGIRGEIYLSLLVTGGMLTITVDESRNLIPPDGFTSCNSYMRVSLIPDEERRTQCRTNMIVGSNNPVFNQTFSVEMLPGDEEKRLLVSMWHRNLRTERSILLGCMTFRVYKLIHSNKMVDGWYFLLTPQVGRHKHLAASRVNMLTYYGSVDSELDAKDPQSNFTKLGWI